MLENGKAFKLLISNDVIWKNETKHEAMLYCKTLYEKRPVLREKIIDYIIKGPSQNEFKNKEDHKDTSDIQIFYKLNFFVSNNIKLTSKGKRKYDDILHNHPELEPNEKALETDKNIDSDDIKKIQLDKPHEVAKNIINYQGNWEYDRRDYLESVGVACIKHPDDCIKLFLELSHMIHELPNDSFNPIFWTLSEGMKDDSGKELYNKLLPIFESMIDIRPEGELWSSLPRMLKAWIKTLKLNFELWNPLAYKLSGVFKSYDNEMTEDYPIEWFQRAINNPFGILTEIYIEYSSKIISEQYKLNKKYQLNDEIINFFDLIVENYNKGSRYGLCLLCRLVGWFESTIYDWTTIKLIPLFYSKNEEQLIVAWSGYLWSRTLSRKLSEDFNNTYLNILNYYDCFSENQKKGLIDHVIGLIWQNIINFKQLKNFVHFVNSEGRLFILEIFRIRLEKTEDKNIQEKFWDDTIIPYWNWCIQNKFLELPDGNKERISFWKLLPFSGKVFQEAKNFAVKYKPNLIQHEGYLVGNFLSSGLANDYPNEFIEFLICFIKVDENCIWNQEKWIELFKSVEKSGDVGLVSKLKDELARKNII